MASQYLLSWVEGTEELLDDSGQAERRYREAIAAMAQGSFAPEHARTRLLYVAPGSHTRSGQPDVVREIPDQIGLVSLQEGAKDPSDIFGVFRLYILIYK